ncbi:MAG: sigma-70 family RNA polymerase sigma factor [Gemmatimonadota bacterium]
MSSTCVPPALDVEERSLVQAVGAGDREALASLFETYAAPMKRVALAVTGSAMEAEDVVQDVFLRLPESIATFECRCPLWGWLRRVTILRARMAVRARRRRRESSLAYEAQAPGSPDTQVELIALERAIALLPPRYRAVLLMRELGGLTHQEIGRALGTTANVSCVTLSRARSRLRHDLDVAGPERG